jgi:Sec-independent protein secretion pathway component TatC
VFSMLLMGIPMYLLYELGGILLRFFPAKRLAAEDDNSDEDGPRIDDDQLASAESRR